MTVAHAMRSGDYSSLRSTLERGFFPAALFRRNRLVISTLSQPAPPARFIPGFKLRWASRRDIGDLTLIKDRPGDFDDFFSEGCLCLVGEIDRIPVSFSWLELDRNHVSRPNSYSFELPAGSSWAFGCEVRGDCDPSLFHLHWYRKMDLLSRGGIDRIYLAIQDDCPSSRLAHARVGFLPVYRMSVLRMLGSTLHKVETLSPGESNGERISLGSWRGSSPPTVERRLLPGGGTP